MRYRFVTRPISPVLLLLFGFYINAADNPSTKLQVQLATVNPDTHQVSIDLFNRGTKTVAAYMLDIQEFDVAGNFVIDKKVGFDYLYYPAPGVDKNVDPRELNLIKPGTGSTYGTGTQPRTVSVKASVLSVVYMDRSLEGDAQYAQSFFDARSQNEKELKEALSATRTYPSTPQQLATTLQTFRSIGSGRALATVATEFHLNVDTYKALRDKNRAIPAIGLPSKEQWSKLISNLSAEANFWQTESQEVAQ